MNSSGIKRGLAASAIGALAVTGVPALTSTANAAVGDNFTVVYTGPALNGGDEGALVIIRAEDGEITPAELELTGTGSPTGGSQNTADQSAEIVGVSDPVNDPANDDYEFIQVRIAVTTTNNGDTATFRLFEDDNPTGADDNEILEASEARQTVSISTAGPLASVDVSPASQSSPENIESGAYTVTLKDAAGRTTQLLEADQLNITPDGTVTVTETGPDTVAASDEIITSDEIVRGTDTFTAVGTAAGRYDILVENLASTIEDTAVLNVTEAANLTEDEINIVTAADSWNDFGDGVDDGTTLVRVDQNTIRFDFDAADSQAGANVQLTVDGFGGVTFAGKDTAVYTTTLDANGNGSITVTADAATIQDGDGFVTDINGFGQRIEFDRATATSIDGAQETYFCQDDAACTVTAVVTDQFGNPVTSGEVEAMRTGPQNVDTTPQRKPVGPDGTVEFTFTDANPIDGGTDTVTFDYFVDQFDNTAETLGGSGDTTIKYSATGQGSDYVISLDGKSTEDADYDAADASIIPLADAIADDDGGDESAAIAITNGEPGQTVTISVDNGALILAPGETKLTEGSSSVEATLDATTGALPANYRVIGTDAGTVTVTVSSANRTETAQMLVEAQDDVSTARNVTVSGPATVEHGTTQIPFVAVVTDAFGNPVQGVPVTDLNIQVTGPAQFQDSDVVTDANGQLTLNVRVDSGAEGPVTIKVTGIPGRNQFGAAANDLDADGTPDAPGLPASSNVATATTVVEEADDVVVPPEDDRPAINPGLKLRNVSRSQKGMDWAKVGARQAAGAKVKLFLIKNNGTRVLWRTGNLSDKGQKIWIMPDKNRRAERTFQAIVVETDRNRRGVTERKSIN